MLASAPPSLRGRTRASLRAKRSLPFATCWARSAIAVAECRRYAIAHRVLKSEFALQRAGRAVRDPIPTPKGKPLLTLKDAAAYIMTLPKKVSDVSMPASSYRRCTSPAQQ
jgi:hypothetical protein